VPAESGPLAGRAEGWPAVGVSLQVGHCGPPSIGDEERPLESCWQAASGQWANGEQSNKCAAMAADCAPLRKRAGRKKVSPVSE